MTVTCCHDLGNRGQVFDKTHSQCVALMRQCGDRLQVTEYSTVQYSTVQYSTVQYSTVCTGDGGEGGPHRAQLPGVGGQGGAAAGGHRQEEVGG